MLQYINCNYKQASEVIKLINKLPNNFGFTCANYFNKKCFIYIGRQDNLFQLINTLAHESRHLQLYLASYYNLDLNSENVCYLLGKIMQNLYTICVHNNFI